MATACLHVFTQRHFRHDFLCRQSDRSRVGIDHQRLEIHRDATVDPIGAGDAFNAGYIAVRLNGGTIDAALRAGARCGAAVTSAPSDTSGFPRSLT